MSPICAPGTWPNYKERSLERELSMTCNAPSGGVLEKNGIRKLIPLGLTL